MVGLLFAGRSDGDHSRLNLCRGGRPYAIDANYRGKGMQLQFTVEDAGVFTMPWTATITYRRPLHTEWEEFVCAENVHEYYAGHAYYSDKDATVPTAEKPDF